MACAAIGPTALSTGTDIHRSIESSAVTLDVVLWNSLINMYGSCGQLDTALVLWDQVQHSQISPSAATVVCVITAMAKAYERVGVCFPIHISYF